MSHGRLRQLNGSSVVKWHEQVGPSFFSRHGGNLSLKKCMLSRWERDFAFGHARDLDDVVPTCKQTSSESHLAHRAGRRARYAIM